MQPHLLDRLQAAGIRRVIDVRAIPQSRKPGFSKRLLGASLEAAGIAYTHLRALGTPKPGRIAARTGRIADMEAIFRAHMQGADAQAALASATALAQAGPVCLLCFEHDAACCHRRLVAEMIVAASGQEVVHL